MHNIHDNGANFLQHHFEASEDQKEYIDLATILAATDNFSDSNLIGQGGFGPVYKVRELTDFLRSSENKFHL